MQTISRMAAALGVFAPRSRREVIAYFALLCALPFLYLSGPAWLATDTGRALSNLGHLPLFGLVALLVHWRLAGSLRREWVWLTGIVAVTGVLTEGLQALVGRDASWADLLRNFIGAWFVWAWLAKSGTGVRWARGLLTAAAGVYIFIFFDVAYTEYRINNQLPVIATFENTREMERWQGRVERSQVHVSEGRYSLQVSLSTATYSSFELNKLPRNWNGYNEFCFDIYNPDDPALELSLRIDDGQSSWRYRDRFNTALTARSGWNYRCIGLDDIRHGPADRALDLGAIERIVVFAVRLPAPRIIYTDNWRLE